MIYYLAELEMICIILIYYLEKIEFMIVPVWMASYFLKI